MWISVGTQWGLQLPLIYLVALVFHQQLAVIWAAHFVYRGVQTVLFVLEWRKEKWAQASVK